MCIRDRLSDSEEAGVYIVLSADRRHIFVTGHSEYDPLTLRGEYLRDVRNGLPIEVPRNYFPADDPSQEPLVRWRGHSNLPVSYTHLRAHETVLDLVCRLLLEKKKKT